MNKFRLAFLFFIVYGTNSNVFSQENTLLLDNNYLFESSASYFDDGLFGLAINNLERSAYEDEMINYQALSSYEIQENRSIDLLLESISRGISDVAKNETYVIIADRYFSQKQYNLAQEYYLKINKRILEDDQRQLISFKSGYCYLTQKMFTQAEPLFKAVAGSNSKLKNDGIYYLGICQYYLDKQELAIASFTQIEYQGRYRSLIPFYLAQIYFKDGDYDKAIDYASSKKSSGGNELLTNRILGMSYLAKEQYDKALPYLNAYADNADKLTENEFYQIGVLNYKLGHFEEAQTYFKELSHQNSKIGQLSNFLLGSAGLKTNNKKDAQSAFKQASKLDYFDDIKNESEFTYYKLSAELNDERVAINGLASIDANGPYFEESQELLSALLLRATDKEAAMSTIENLPSKNESLLNTYKKLAYEQALQQLEDNNIAEAISNLKSAIETPGSQDVTNDAQFWLGYAYNENEEYAKSNDALNSYLNSGATDHKFESQYMIAYHQMEAKQYDDAMKTLETSINSFDVNTDEKLLFDDAIVRLADLELVRNNYAAAIEYYDLAISNNAAESDYILFQKALIYGVNNQTIEKLTSLENLVKKYPNSSYRDDAFFEIGETLIALGKNNEAYQIYNSVIIEFGNSSKYTALSHMRKGLISYNQGDLYAALDAYKQGIKLTTDKEEKRRALIAVEEIYLNELNDPDAYFAFTEEETGYKINNISKDSITYHVALNSYKDNLYEKAIGQFESYISKFNTGFYKTDAYYYLAESFVVLKNYKSALQHYEKVLEQKGSTYYASSLEKAALIAFNHSQNFASSLKYYSELIEMNSELNIDYLEAALYSAFKTQDQNSVINYGHLLIDQANVSPESKSAANYYLGKTYYNLKESEKAKNAFLNVVSLSSNNQAAESSYLVAKILFEQGQIEAAEEAAFETTSKAANYPI
ncbi:MAG: tetratricopeptide repeat protein, partial [Bacteroidia bacterium]|nr:tetratricopeptide repeat protein [Bacteroidia bacterium]